MADQPIQKNEAFSAPANQALESGAWTQSIIWDSKTPFRPFTQIEFPEDDENLNPELRDAGESYEDVDETSLTITLFRNFPAKEETPCRLRATTGQIQSFKRPLL